MNKYRVKRVIDGDTFEIFDGGGIVPRKIRLANIDAPEISALVERAAASHLQGLIENQLVTLLPDPGPMDFYCREVTQIWHIHNAMEVKTCLN